MRVVPDTNVLIAAIVAKGLCAEVVVHGIRNRSFVTSDLLLDELEATLRRNFEITSSVATFLAKFRNQVTLVEPATLATPVCRDSSDDVVLATAVAAAADAIVTGDNDLLSLREYERIAIISPREYLIRIGERAGGQE